MDIYKKGQMDDSQMGDKGLVKGSRNEIIMGPSCGKEENVGQIMWNFRKDRKDCGPAAEDKQERN